MTVKQFAIRFTKVVVGVALALGIISLAGVAIAKYFLTQLTHLPERPAYNNDASEQAETAAAPAPAQPEPEAATPAPTESPAEPPAEPEPNSLYEATVTQPIGLLVRSGPGVEHGQLGGVDFEDTLAVLEESNGWIRIRSQTGQEGWVKGGGNIQRLN